MRRSIAFSALVALVLMLVAAGCGKSSDTKANEEYADNVCSAVGTWRQQIESIGTSLTSGFTKDSLQSAVTNVESATKTMVNQIKAVSPPDTSEGKAAKQQIDQLTSDLNSTVDAAKTASDQLQANASASSIATAVAALAPQVKSLASEAKSAFDTLKSAGGSLSKAFKNTDSCKNLSSSG
jgi:Tfp pilus assembly protein PilP